MDFEYTGRHIDVTPALRAHVEEHFGKVGNLFGNASTARARGGRGLPVFSDPFRAGLCLIVYC